jgi:hypothetical protein
MKSIMVKMLTVVKMFTVVVLSERVNGCNHCVAFTILFVKNEFKHVIFYLRPSPYAIFVMKDLLQREGVISSLVDAYFWKMKLVHPEFNYKSNFAMEVEDNDKE